VEFLCALVILPNIVKTLVCISASRILTYGLEIVIPKGKILDDIQNYYKKLLKQLLSLTINVADPAVYMISGLLPLEAEIHTKVFADVIRLFHFVLDKWFCI
jgi:hypothetical protein